MKEIKYIILCRVCENFCDSILLRLRFRNVINYDFGSAKAKSYGSGSATLIASLLFLMYYTVDFNLHFIFLLFYPLIAGS
jgi:hypothetical protein